jgi:heparan-alpha-glucosaminide N-acetyltransferase
MSESVAPAITPPPRNSAVDAYRGFVMLLMLGEVLHFASVAQSFPKSYFWHILAYNQSHVEWTGMSLHDTIQPSFTFLVGVALPYSLRSRRRRGESFGHMLGHTLWRSFLLVALGIFLRSVHSTSTYFTFEDTLTQIGLGYTFAFLLALCSPRWQWIAFGTILFGYWLAWALYPAPGSGFNYASVGVPPEWSQHLFHGFPSHWNKNSNLGQAFDLWFLNLFPRPTPFLFNDGGYLTLSFIPTLGTMLLGLAAGRWLLADSSRIPFRRFLTAAVVLIGSGLLLHFLGACPVVKRIWTPSWTLVSGGVCFLFLAAFSWVVDVRKQQRIAFPLIVIGMNSIAAYLMSYLFSDFIQNSFHVHLGASLLNVFGTALQPVVLGTLTLCVYWFLLFRMYTNKIFIRI